MNVNTSYIPVSTISPPDLSHIGGDWDECPPEYEEGSAELICKPSSDKQKCTAAAFLDETLRLEGCGNTGDSCFCGLAAPVFRCQDCFGMRMLCNQCVLHSHASNPLHRIDMWSNSYFQCTSLKQIGLHMQLGHNPGEICYNPHPSTGDDFVVIDVHGIHEIALDFCVCASSQVHYKQLLCACWYPATTSEPCTAATFSLLKHFHLLSFESKNHYSAFMCILHRAGRGHDPAGVIATSVGELAVQFPACPHPGKNIPEGWQDALLTVRWKYMLFVAINANFQLKQKAVSLDNIDPNLNSGWAAYKLYLADQASVKQEHSMCVSHNAVNLVDTKSSCGLTATGVGAVDCTRHNMKLANSVRDLQKGEKYINMDYLVFSSLLAFVVTIINILYDIACQWHKKLWVQMEAMPSRLHIPHHSMSIQFFILKFHLKAYIDEYQWNFSFNWTKHVGQTDGEAPECGWSNIDHVASSTKEMGPGSCQDTLNDHFGDWSWKIIMVLAVKWKKEHGEALAELENTIQPTLIIQWRKEVEAWEEDNSNSNPFESRYTHAAVQLQLTELEAHELQAGTNVSLHTDVSPSRLITTGIDLQDQQRAHVQELYMPVMSQLHHRTSDASMLNTVELKPNTFKLWLPLELQPMTSHIYIYKDRNIHDQAASTHVQAIINGVELRKQVSVKKYCCTCNSGWEILLPPLLDLDVQPMGDMESQGTGTILWIWLDSWADNSSSENEQVWDFLYDANYNVIGICMEWCKVHARVNRWSEEVKLLLEEMQRVVVFLKWQAEWWSGQATDEEGAVAYAYHQAAMMVSKSEHTADLHTIFTHTSEGWVCNLCK
ncbi:hypothetical protein BDR04DRAFT_1124244 [Suillus decipiens]|nr:hypothetical protein BDR04DRAFT_1124244 [Suillus decipiens]